MHHQFLRPKWPIKHVSHDIHATFSFVDLIWPDLDLDLYLVQGPYLYATFFITWEALLQSLGLQLLLVLSREPIRRKVTILTFDLTWTLLVFFIFFNSLKKYSLRAFDCRLAHLTTAAGSRVRRGGGGCNIYPRVGEGGRSAWDPSGARVKWRHVTQFWVEKTSIFKGFWNVGVGRKTQQ